LDSLLQNQKARRLLRRRASNFFKISLAFLAQAIAVRRHIGPVMVMMTVMAVALHLFQRYGIDLIVSIESYRRISALSLQLSS
jgi:hypothetical protein